MQFRPLGAVTGQAQRRPDLPVSPLSGSGRWASASSVAWRRDLLILNARRLDETDPTFSKLPLSSPSTSPWAARFLLSTTHFCFADDHLQNSAVPLSSAFRAQLTCPHTPSTDRIPPPCSFLILPLEQPLTTTLRFVLANHHTTTDMLVNKKLDRFKQWAGEKMGGEARTALSDEFKALELEMNLRHEGSHPLAIVTQHPVAL